MVVSGVPEENDTKHVMNIANIALAMREASDFTFNPSFPAPNPLNIL